MRNHVQQSVQLLESPSEKMPLGKARNMSHTPLMKLSESSRNMLGRRGNSVVQNSVGMIHSPSGASSSQPSAFTSQKRFGTKRNSVDLPKLNQNRFS